MDMLKHYRWFYTASGKKVVGGKNAEQNDTLLREIIAGKEKYYVMHTSTPGSPFSVIMAPLSKVNDEDLNECAIFTGCFSREWRDKKKQARIDVFTSDQLSKEKEMKAGMWKVKGQIKHMNVELKLALTKQKGVLRAVPLMSAKKVIVSMIPGNIDKQDAAIKIELTTGDKLDMEQLVSALPAGGIKIT
jgi:hypothetical protein